MGRTQHRRLQLVNQFRDALRTGEVIVHYQPKIALPDQRLTGAEALVRWRHPEFGRLSPDEFVPIIEKAGLAHLLDEFMLYKAANQCREWLDSGESIGVAVNLSVRSIADPALLTQVEAVLKDYDLPAELLTLELTESGIMADPQRALPALHRLREQGIVLSVDNFGTGFSSLAYLRQLPIDEVKIDRSFVLGMGSDLGDLAVVRAVVELGHALGVSVVAEGVEDSDALDQLAGMGCDTAQGHHISRPMSPDNFGKWLRTRTRQTTTPDGKVVRTFLG